jgi:hypothetical protein
MMNLPSAVVVTDSAAQYPKANSGQECGSGVPARLNHQPVQTVVNTMELVTVVLQLVLQALQPGPAKHCCKL